MSNPIRLPPLKETVGLVSLLAHNARLDNPLPANTDFTDDEFKEVQTQLNAFMMLPPSMRPYIYITFSAKELPGLVRVLRTLSRTTQRKAFSTLIQILSLLEDPKRDPYFRRFLRSPHAAGLPNIIADAFVQGIDWLRPSGPGHISSLIITTLQWCDPELGDDKRASVDASIRQALITKMTAFISAADFGRLDELQRIETQRLLGTLQSIDNMQGPPEGPPGWFMNHTYNWLIEGIPGQEECAVCMEEDHTSWCSRCKTVKYCGTACQTKDWKEGHKLRCFEVTL
ncbi:hypothetical protein EXIGLDRAFT_754727 [Exidia glandulosa HHB12029]|uniref:MYND-type domain-containing protein n=1 Tax=Exidia glandulosa HHB12029 TaxID=1314781 RepID=A0A165CNP2_EXIGL|nr:hypothetical protein EXIGLDRAFT_754727 [Exidia glandulosa HHB12029]